MSLYHCTLVLEIDGPAALFPIAVAGGVETAAPVDFLGGPGRGFGPGLAGAGRIIGIIEFRISHGDSSSP